MTNHLYIRETAVLKSPVLRDGLVIHLEEQPDPEGGFDFYFLPMNLEVARELRNQLDVALGRYTPVSSAKETP